MFRDRYLGSNDRRNAAVAIKQEIILKQAFFPHTAHTEELVCTSFSSQYLHRIYLSFIFLILWRSPSGETRQTNVHILNTDNADCHKNDSHTQLFNSVLSQAGGSVYLMMTVWVLQAVWPAP